jgi:hypothetical protein
MTTTKMTYEEKVNFHEEMLANQEQLSKEVDSITRSIENLSIEDSEYEIKMTQMLNALSSNLQSWNKIINSKIVVYLTE